MTGRAELLFADGAERFPAVEEVAPPTDSGELLGNTTQKIVVRFTDDATAEYWYTNALGD